MSPITFTYYAVLTKYGHLKGMGASGKPFLFKNRSMAQRRAGSNGHVVTLHCTVTGVESGNETPSNHSEAKALLMRNFPEAFGKNGT